MFGESFWSTLAPSLTLDALCFNRFVAVYESCLPCHVASVEGPSFPERVMVFFTFDLGCRCRLSGRLVREI